MIRHSQTWEGREHPVRTHAGNVPTLPGALHTCNSIAQLGTDIWDGYMCDPKQWSRPS